MLQRSKEWYDARLGRFTASRISELMGVKGLGLTGENYAFELACEEVFGIEEDADFVSYDMQRGINLEPMAFEKFKLIKQLEFIDVQKCSFFAYGQNSGASPDGLVNNVAILEIKCPRSNKFFKLVKDSIIDKNYIYQMQMQMMCTNSIKAHFFNYLIFNGVEMWHEIIVERDEKMIDLIKSRINEASKLKEEFKQYLINNKQF